MYSYVCSRNALFMSLQHIIYTILISLSVLITWGCQPLAQKTTQISMVTDLGNITLVLYNETPVHRDNFLALIEEDFFNGMYFHRVVPGFIIQAGDPRTKAADSSEGQSASYTLPAEITGTHIHTAGKLAAARQPDEQNPEWRSSESQFYIVTGSKVYEEELTEVEKRLNMRARAKLYDEFLQFKQDPNNPIDFDLFLDYKNYKDQSYYTPAMRKAYAQKGGAPNLDFQYTIFGEVLLGMDVVNKIGQIPVENEQPLKQIRILNMEVVNSNP